MATAVPPVASDLAAPTLHQILKDGTADLHRSIEGRTRMARLTSPDLTREDYAETLARFHAFLSSVEAWWGPGFAWTRDCPDLVERKKTPALQKDLKSLGVAPREIESTFRGSLRDHSEAAGVMYVLEGSSLGGQVIARELAERSFGQPENLHYFTLYGPRTGLLWRQFLAQIAKWDEAGMVDHARALTAARGVFEDLQRQMQDDTPEAH